MLSYNGDTTCRRKVGMLFERIKIVNTFGEVMDFKSTNDTKEG